jgi:hypothetical protein
VSRPRPCSFVYYEPHRWPNGEMIVFCVVFCRSVIVLFLLAIVLPALALGDLKTLLALFLKQKRVRKCTWLAPIQCEKNTCTIFNRVQFKSFKIPKRKGRQYNGQKKKDNQWSTKHYTENSFPPQRYIFSQETKIRFLFFGHKKKSVISLQIFIIDFSLRTVGPD